MTNHLHMVVGTLGKHKVSDIIRDFKKFTSKEIIKTLKTDSKESRRDWMLERYRIAALDNDKIKDYKFWQDGNNAVCMLLNEYIEQKVNYIHANPVKAEIVLKPEEYIYSSAIDYCDGKGLIDVVRI